MDLRAKLTPEFLETLAEAIEAAEPSDQVEAVNLYEAICNLANSTARKLLLNGQSESVCPECRTHSGIDISTYSDTHRKWLCHRCSMHWTGAQLVP